MFCVTITSNVAPMLSAAALPPSYAAWLKDLSSSCPTSVTTPTLRAVGASVGASVAGISVAGISVAGISVAGISVAGASVAGGASVVAGLQAARIIEAMINATVTK